MKVHPNPNGVWKNISVTPSKKLHNRDFFHLLNLRGGTCIPRKFSISRGSAKGYDDIHGNCTVHFRPRKGELSESYAFEQPPGKWESQAAASILIGDTQQWATDHESAASGAEKRKYQTSVPTIAPNQRTPTTTQYTRLLAQPWAAAT